MMFGYSLSLHEHTFEIRHTFRLKPPRGKNWISEEVVQWCCDMFGDDARDRWDFNLDTVFFTYKDDAFHFKMRWC